MMNPQALLQFKNKLKEETVFGCFVKSCDGIFAETAGYAGFDYCIIDMEHGPISTDKLQELIRACECGGAAAIVRVPDISEQSIGKPLDLGAAGVQIPQVSTPEEAQKAVSLAKFYPNGERGVCRFVRAARYSSLEKTTYFQEANDALVILQVEGKQGVEHIDEILKIDGIDIIFIGPYDLSQSLGVPGEVEHPLMTDTMKELVEKAQSKGICVGTFVDSVEAGIRWRELGVHYISYSVDAGIFYEACRDAVKQFYA